MIYAVETNLTTSDIPEDLSYYMKMLVRISEGTQNRMLAVHQFSKTMNAIEHPRISQELMDSFGSLANGTVGLYYDEWKNLWVIVEDNHTDELMPWEKQYDARNSEFLALEAARRLFSFVGHGRIIGRIDPLNQIEYTVVGRYIKKDNWVFRTLTDILIHRRAINATNKRPI